MAKNNSKSIRLSDETLSYIKNYVGNGFNEKFENIILYAMKTESERIERLKQLDIQIELKRKVYNDILEKIRSIDIVLYNALDLDRKIRFLKNDIDKLIISVEYNN